MAYARLTPQNAGRYRCEGSGAVATALPGATGDPPAARAAHTFSSPSTPPSLVLLPVTAAKLILMKETILPEVVCQ